MISSASTNQGKRNKPERKQKERQSSMHEPRTQISEEIQCESGLKEKVEVGMGCVNSP